MLKTSTNSIRILIVDDHPVVRAGLAGMLGTQLEFEIVGSAPSGEVALSVLGQSAVDVILLDLHMPETTGVQTIIKVKQAGYTARVIILTSYETDEDIYRAVQAGAQGYLLKDVSLEEMVEAIRTVHAGKRYIPREIASRLADRMMHVELTGRELEILKMVSKGLTNKDIGRVLGISNFTVKNHVNSIIEKLDVCDRTEAATVAIQRGLITISA